MAKCNILKPARSPSEVCPTSSSHNLRPCYHKFCPNHKVLRDAQSQILKATNWGLAKKAIRTHKSIHPCISVAPSFFLLIVLKMENDVMLMRLKKKNNLPVKNLNSAAYQRQKITQQYFIQQIYKYIIFIILKAFLNIFAGIQKK